MLLRQGIMSSHSICVYFQPNEFKCPYTVNAVNLLLVIESALVRVEIQRKLKEIIGASLQDGNKVFGY